jgi:starch synthase (maltosyl-transferring)
VSLLPADSRIIAGLSALNAESLTGTRSEALEQALLPSSRIVITNVWPVVDAGTFAAKRIVGDRLRVEADIFADGHETIAAAICVRAPGARGWTRIVMQRLVNDRWLAEATLEACGRWQYRVEAWLDTFGSFVDGTTKKEAAGLPLALEAVEGRQLVAAAHDNASGPVKTALSVVLGGWDALPAEKRIALLLADETQAAMRSAGGRPFLARSDVYTVNVERRRAGFAAWYELFPRSFGGNRHGTFRDVIADLPRIHALGFDVLYMPPIHPIGLTNRKGRNNALRANPDDPGSPYAIGSPAGGHDAVHPKLGSLEDFRALVDATRALDMEIALDFAVQMSPDHPWLSEHPGWFEKRPDGSMKYAENPPKKYEDIVNPSFYTDRAVWLSLRDVLMHWIAQGVRIFRVDNPHTKPFPFWQWLIADIRDRHPETIFLAEAFTRPKPMYQLAKIGFSQSYTYFTWRNTKRELTEYLEEVSTPPVSDFFRPHFFVNTPDINPYFLQTSGRAGFLIRAALAATLSGLWGMYSGFELCEGDALPGREEYLNAEKYELKHRNFKAGTSIAPQIAQLNAVRVREPHFHSQCGLTFYNAFNDNILYYGKTASGREDRVLVAVSLDPHNEQSCDFEIPLWEWGLPDHESLAVEDLLNGYKFSWTGKVQHLRLSPASPYAIWRIQPEARQ